METNRNLRVVEVTFENGDTITASMSANLTDQEIRDYYKVGSIFNLGSVEDEMTKVKEVKIIK